MQSDRMRRIYDAIRHNLGVSASAAQAKAEELANTEGASGVYELGKAEGLRLAEEIVASYRECLPYYTVVIPWSPEPTAWHPREQGGKFDPLTRGAFPTEKQAHDWAREHLGGQPYWVELVAE